MRAFRQTREARAAAFLARSRQRHNDRFDYSQAEYAGTRRKIQLACRRHGPFTATPKAHLHTQSGGCPACLRALKTRNGRTLHPPRTTAEWVAKARLVHGDRYDYDHVRYANTDTQVILVCSRHGPFRITPDKHLAGCGCRKCAFEKLRHERRLSIWIVAARCLAAHGTGRYDQYDLRGFRNQYSKIRVHCPAHGWFRQSAVAHWRGHGCFRCSDSRGERRIRRCLSQLGIAFVEQVRFPECRDQRPLPFDFYLPDARTLIEYDGRQHFERSELWGGQHELEQTRRRDAIRDQFAAEHSYRLIRIPCWDFERIEPILAAALNLTSNV